MTPLFPEPVLLRTNGINLALYEQGQGWPVIFLHGFPELAYSWRRQFPAVAAAGYRAIAIDQRGYGYSDAPQEVAEYRIQQLIADVHGVLDALEIEKATFVGHDWGSLLLWHMSLTAPERTESQVILNIPFHPRTSVDPIELFRARLGDNFYIVNFQDSDEADHLFASDVEHFFTMMMRKGQISRSDFEKLPGERKSLDLIKTMKRQASSGEPLLDDEERRYYVKAYRRSGFTGPINWYRNWTENWRSLRDVEQRVRVPTLFIGAHDDVVVSLEHIESMKRHVDDLEVHVLPDCGHWTQQEQPGEVNRLIIDWLARRSVSDS